jgi:hypothetical protein
MYGTCRDSVIAFCGTLKTFTIITPSILLDLAYMAYQILDMMIESLPLSPITTHFLVIVNVA